MAKSKITSAKTALEAALDKVVGGIPNKTVHGLFGCVE